MFPKYIYEQSRCSFRVYVGYSALVFVNYYSLLNFVNIFRSIFPTVVPGNVASSAPSPSPPNSPSPLPPPASCSYSGNEAAAGTVIKTLAMTTGVRALHC